jgi:hypothetical protein
MLTFCPALRNFAAEFRTRKFTGKKTSGSHTERKPPEWQQLPDILQEMCKVHARVRDRVASRTLSDSDPGRLAHAGLVDLVRVCELCVSRAPGAQLPAPPEFSKFENVCCPVGTLLDNGYLLWTLQKPCIKDQ